MTTPSQPSRRAFLQAALRYLSITGMFALPEYCGNRDLAGYRLIGFEDRHGWTPPFGYYDAHYRERGQ